MANLSAVRTVTGATRPVNDKLLLLHQATHYFFRKTGMALWQDGMHAPVAIAAVVEKLDRAPPVDGLQTDTRIEGLTADLFGVGLND